MEVKIIDKMLKKLFLFIGLATCCYFVSCQSNKTFQTYEYDIEQQQNESYAHFSDFLEFHPDPIFQWMEPRTWRYINDTAYYIASDNGKYDTIYVYNTKTYKTTKIPLTQIDSRDTIYLQRGDGIRQVLRKKDISSVYYHTPDSIFLFYDRHDVVRWKTTQAHPADFILIDTQGNIKGEYSLDKLDNIYFAGDRTGKRFCHASKMIGNRIVNNELLLHVYTYYDSDTIEIEYNPQCVCLYNLQTGVCRLLNIRTPNTFFNKVYFEHRSCYWILRAESNDLFVFYEYSPEIYRYDFEKNTLVPYNSHYDNVFVNMDSASMRAGKPTMIARFWEPVWLPAENCYVRRISILLYKNFAPWSELYQVLDSKFQHKGYIVRKDNKLPYLYGNELCFRTKHEDITSLTPEKNTNRPIDDCSGILQDRKEGYSIHLKSKPQKINLAQVEKEYDRPKVDMHKDTLHSMSVYFDSLHIPKRPALGLIVNMKYPCSSCYLYLFSTLQKNQKLYEENDIYFIFYDPTGTHAMDYFLKKYGLANTKCVLKDTNMLDRVDIDGYGYFGKQQYILVNYLMEGEKSGTITCSFDILQVYWEQAVKDFLEKKKTNNIPKE